MTPNVLNQEDASLLMVSVTFKGKQILDQFTEELNP